MNARPLNENADQFATSLLVINNGLPNFAFEGRDSVKSAQANLLFEAAAIFYLSFQRIHISFISF